MRLLIVLLLLHLSPALFAGGDFTLTILDIPDIQRGAGLAIVLQTPAGRTFLYDTGSAYSARASSDGWESNFNAGRDLIDPFLKQQGIKQLDGVMISHAHYDHFGGLLWLADHFPITKLIDSGYAFPGTADGNYTGELGDYNKLRDDFKKRGAYFQANTGESIDLDPSLKVEVLAPPKNYFTEPHPESRPKKDPPAHYLVNSNSLGVRIQYGDIVFYLPGDI